MSIEYLLQPINSSVLVDLAVVERAITNTNVFECEKTPDGQLLVWRLPRSATADSSGEAILQLMSGGVYLGSYGLTTEDEERLVGHLVSFFVRRADAVKVSEP